MISVLMALVSALSASFRSRVELQREVLALRQQIHVLERSRRSRPRLLRTDRAFWIWLSRVWPGWRRALIIVQPATVIAWHRQGFRWFWRWKSRRRAGRPAVSTDVRALIRSMSDANPLWGAPRIHGELLKLGIAISQASVAKYMVCHRRPPSQTWCTFLTNHTDQLMAADFFVVPTVTYRLLFVLVLLAHDRRRIVDLAVTAHPTAAWTAQQLREACPWDSAPRHLIHDRDHAFDGIGTTAKAMEIHEVLTAPGAPWQNAYAERFIGSVRRECLDHVLVFNAAGLRHVLHTYRSYYERSRTHLSLAKDTPISRPIMDDGPVVTIPEVGGLHHRYERWAA
jgi:putative transposase